MHGMEEDGVDYPEGLLREDRSPNGYGVSGSGSVLLEFKDESSDKFWGLLEDEGSFIAFWGRNGRRPQQSQHIARGEASARLREKLAKGYEVAAKEGLLRKAFAEAPEWFENIKEASGQFMALVEKSKLRLEIEKSEKERPAAAKQRKAFRI